MLITKITRTYSKSINSKAYNLPESWIRVEATYEAQVESSDDPIKCSEMLYDQAKKEVMENVEAIVSLMRNKAAGLQNIAGGAVSPVTTPVAPGAPMIPTYPRPLS